MTRVAKKAIVVDITNINEKIYDLIKSRITSLEYPPGYQINIPKLQEEIGVSSSPIKDALARLAGEELVEITSRKGTFVKDVSDRDIIEIEQFRTLLEVGAVDIVSDGITDEQIEMLEKRHRVLVSENNYQIFMRKDREFHLAIIMLTNNERLINTYKRLNAHAQILRFKFAQNQNVPYAWTLQDHMDIIEALRSRNAEKAKQAIRSHRIKARDALLEKRNQETQ
jgi:DNA-binding GntR family transcriptional regulator